MNAYITKPQADDRETSLIALQDIHVLLLFLAQSFNKRLSELRVYDPYYCKGSVKTRLESLGCCRENVFNDDVDCYETQKNNSVPLFDVLLTNPPYSGDHIKRSLNYATSCGKPWALLLPSNILQREWFQEKFLNACMTYLAPHKRYIYENELSTTDKSHVPFVTMWCIGGISDNNQKE